MNNFYKYLLFLFTSTCLNLNIFANTGRRLGRGKRESVADFKKRQLRENSRIAIGGATLKELSGIKISNRDLFCGPRRTSRSNGRRNICARITQGSLNLILPILPALLRTTASTAVSSTCGGVCPI